MRLSGDVDMRVNVTADLFGHRGPGVLHPLRRVFETGGVTQVLKEEVAGTLVDDGGHVCLALEQRYERLPRLGGSRHGPLGRQQDTLRRGRASVRRLRQRLRRRPRLTSRFFLDRFIQAVYDFVIASVCVCFGTYCIARRRQHRSFFCVHELDGIDSQAVLGVLHRDIGESVLFSDLYSRQIPPNCRRVAASFARLSRQFRGPLPRVGYFRRDSPMVAVVKSVVERLTGGLLACQLPALRAVHLRGNTLKVVGQVPASQVQKSVAHLLPAPSAVYPCHARQRNPERVFGAFSGKSSVGRDSGSLKIRPAESFSGDRAGAGRRQRLGFRTHATPFVVRRLDLPIQDERLRVDAKTVRPQGQLAYGLARVPPVVVNFYEVPGDVLVTRVLRFDTRLERLAQLGESDIVVNLPGVDDVERRVRARIVLLQLEQRRVDLVPVDLPRLDHGFPAFFGRVGLGLAQFLDAVVALLSPCLARGFEPLLVSQVVLSPVPVFAVDLQQLLFGLRLHLVRVFFAQGLFSFLAARGVSLLPFFVRLDDGRHLLFRHGQPLADGLFLQRLFAFRPLLRPALERLGPLFLHGLIELSPFRVRRHVHGHEVLEHERREDGVQFSLEAQLQVVARPDFVGNTRHRAHLMHAHPLHLVRVNGLVLCGVPRFQPLREIAGIDLLRIKCAVLAPVRPPLRRLFLLRRCLQVLVAGDIQKEVLDLDGN